MPAISDIANEANEVIGPTLLAADIAGWVKEEYSQQEVKALQREVAKLEKDPVVVESVRVRDEIGQELSKAKVALKTLSQEGSLPGMSAEQRQNTINAVSDYVKANQESLDAIGQNPRLQELHQKQMEAAYSQHILKERSSHILGGASLAVDAAGTTLGVAEKVATIASPTIGATIGTVAGVGAVPLAAASTALSAGQTMLDAKKLYNTHQTKGDAHEMRAKHAEDPMIAAIAKRVEMKQSKNEISQGLNVVAGGAATTASAISTVGGAVNLTVGLAGAAPSMGAAPAVIAATTMAASSAATAVSMGASGADVAYSAGRHLHSSSEKKEILSASQALREMSAQGKTTFDYAEAKAEKAAEKQTIGGAMKPEETKALSTSERKAIQKVQDHAVKHDLRAATTDIQAQVTSALYPDGNEPDMKALGKKEAKAITSLKEDLTQKFTAEKKAELQEDYKDVSKLLNHSCEMIVQRDTTAAMNHLAGALRAECSEHSHLINESIVVYPSELPDTSAVNLCKDMGMEPNEIASLASSVSNPKTLEQGVNELGSRFKVS